VRGLNDRTLGAAWAAVDGLDVLIHGVFFSFLFFNLFLQAGILTACENVH
jgi:hypothetical protein